LNPFTILLVAFILDLLLGDPYSWPHPVKWMGYYIRFFQEKSRMITRSKRQQFWLGVGLWASLMVISFLLLFFSLYLLTIMHPLLANLWRIYLTYTTFSVRMLAVEAQKVYRALEKRSLEKARQQVGVIVGRTTDSLNAPEIVAATIETVAENTSDGFIAPLLYNTLFGIYGGILYKAINTLDSMVGYQNETYRYFGRFSAKVDDVVNIIPARVTWFFMLVVSILPRFNHKNAWKIGRRDAKAHKSPNAGFPEAVVAGALEIQLGGSHVYHGVEVYKPTIGDPIKRIETTDILKANNMLYLTAGLAMICTMVIFIFI
jgi:adenosylcobinamide-phosphate synthase